MNRSRMDARDYTIQLRQAMRRFLPPRGLALTGSGRWCDRLLVTTVLLMVFSSFPSLQERFAEARAAVVKMYLSRKRPGATYAGFMGMLRHHSERLLERVTGSLRRHVRRVAQGDWKVGRHLAFGADGSKSDATRTCGNRQKLKIGGKKKSGPQQLLVTLLHVGTGLVWSWRRGEAVASERALLLQQLFTLPAGVLLLADAGFAGYELIRTMMAAGHQVLVRAGGNITLLKKLGWEVQVKERTGLVYLWPKGQRSKGRPPLVLRQIVLVDGKNRRMCLLTSVLKVCDLTVSEARELYRRRWGIELFFRGLKQTLGRRKMLSDSPENAVVELDWTMAGYWMLGLLLWENRKDKMPVNQGLAWALGLVRRAMAGRGDKRGNWKAAWRKLTVDRYPRLHPKKSRDWPHKKNERPCGLPKLRMATKLEVRCAKLLKRQKLAA